MGVEIRHLRAFRTVAQVGSISRAAELLLVTQPALSRTLAQLERHLGRRLLVRSSNGIALTTDGEAFLAKAALAVAAFDEALDTSATDALPLRVGYQWSALGEHTARLLRTWREMYPTVRIELRRHEDRYAGLLDGKSDVAILRGEVDDDRLHVELLYSESRLAAFHSDHPLANADAVRMADLAGYGMIVNVVSGVSGPDLWPSGSRPEVAVEVTNIEDWRTALLAGAGFGVTARSTPFLYPYPGITFVPIVDAPDIAVRLARLNGNRHPALPEFFRLAHTIVSEVD